MKHDLSYGIYLYGWPVSQALVQLMPNAMPVQIAALTLLILVPIAAASWHLVEKPAQRLGHKLARPRPSGAWARARVGWPALATAANVKQT